MVFDLEGLLRPLALGDVSSDAHHRGDLAGFSSQGNQLRIQPPVEIPESCRRFAAKGLSGFVDRLQRGLLTAGYVRREQVAPRSADYCFGMSPKLARGELVCVFNTIVTVYDEDVVLRRFGEVPVPLLALPQRFLRSGIRLLLTVVLLSFFS